ncbi:hypothetical protein HMPREF9446_01226 [Bacteroides fluxus YIT 12057]|uniref:Uncharacterized protein n=1 Tax=Bacteroides fluxus YIT 12057 TaxID=763034 RepID=F3PR77_9BACE|nr:hypothetical protein HMPREF9446_01226 [Bacteroides fluxus YIT 12057]
MIFFFITLVQINLFIIKKTGKGWLCDRKLMFIFASTYKHGLL